MKSLKQVLAEFDYGNSLFADPDSIQNATSYGDKYKKWLDDNDIDFEDDTDEEYEALLRIARYIQNGGRDHAQKAAAFIAKHGKLLKAKFPEILDPEHDYPIDELYRGGSLPLERIIEIISSDAKWQARIKPGGDVHEFIMEHPKNWGDMITSWLGEKSGVTDPVSQAFIPFDTNTSVTSRNKQGFLSTSTSWDEARSFASRSIPAKLKAKRWAVVVQVPYNKVKSNTYINPSWAASVAEFKEDEVWVLGDTLPVNRIWIRAKNLGALTEPKSTSLNTRTIAFALIEAIYTRYIDRKEFEMALRKASQQRYGAPVEDPDAYFDELKSKSLIDMY